MKTLTEQVAKAVAASGLEPLLPHGYARCALMTDFSTVEELNGELRKIIPEWREDDWSIGHDGAGNYFIVSQSNSYSGVKFWDHEMNEIRDEFDSIESFIADALEIERENKKQAEQGGAGQPATRPESK